jgi:hypothetical protein
VAVDPLWLSLIVRAPRRPDEAGPNRMRAPIVLAPATACAVVDIFPGSGFPDPLVVEDRDGVMVRFVSDAPCSIAFGANTMGAPVVGLDWPLFTHSPQEFYAEPNWTRYFRAISTPGANLLWYVG